MAFYKKQFNQQSGVYFPQAITVGKPVTTKQVAERLAQISTVSKSDVAAVLGDLAGVIADYMSQGKSVKIDGLGTFRYTLNTEGVENEKDFDAQKQIKAVRVQFTPQREGNTKQGTSATRALVPAGLEWIEYGGVGVADPSDPDEDGEGDDDLDPMG